MIVSNIRHILSETFILDLCLTHLYSTFHSKVLHIRQYHWNAAHSGEKSSNLQIHSMLHNSKEILAKRYKSQWSSNIHTEQTIPKYLRSHLKDSHTVNYTVLGSIYLRQAKDKIDPAQNWNTGYWSSVTVWFTYLKTSPSKHISNLHPFPLAFLQFKISLQCSSKSLFSGLHNYDSRSGFKCTVNWKIQVWVYYVMD